MRSSGSGESTGECRVDHIDVDTGVDLVAGLLGAEARRKWLKHAASCGPCESLLRRLAGDAARLSAVAVPDAARVNESDSARHVIPRFRRHAWGGGWRRRVVTAAAALVFATGAWYVLERPDRGVPGGELAPIIPPSPGAVVPRGDADAPFSDALNRAVADYDAGRLRDAQARLEALAGERPAGDPGGDLVRVYLASARARLGDWPGAVRALEGVDVESLPEPWRGVALSVRANAAARGAHPGAAGRQRGRPSGDRIDSPH